MLRVRYAGMEVVGRALEVFPEQVLLALLKMKVKRSDALSSSSVVHAHDDDEDDEDADRDANEEDEDEDEHRPTDFELGIHLRRWLSRRLCHLRNLDDLLDAIIDQRPLSLPALVLQGASMNSSVQGLSMASGNPKLNAQIERPGASRAPAAELSKLLRRRLLPGNQPSIWLIVAPRRACNPLESYFTFIDGYAPVRLQAAMGAARLVRAKLWMSYCSKQASAEAIDAAIRGTDTASNTRLQFGSCIEACSSFVAAVTLAASTIESKGTYVSAGLRADGARAREQTGNHTWEMQFSQFESSASFTPDSFHADANLSGDPDTGAVNEATPIDGSAGGMTRVTESRSAS